MSISNSLSNALSGMTASARMAEVVSSNVSNALTEGYGRRSLELSAASIGGRGAGVEIGSVTRNIDAGIIADRRLSDASLGAYEYLVSVMGDLEEIVGRPGEGGSIADRIVAVETALVDAASDPASDLRLDALKGSFSALTSGLNDAAKSIQDKRADADATIATLVSDLNDNLVRVERLNADITYSRNSGNDPSGLMDERQRIIDRIAEIVPVKEYVRDGGQVALMTPSGEMLIDGKAKQYQFTANPVITADMTVASGGLSGLMRDGVAISGDGIGKLSGGALGAAFRARDLDLPGAAAGLDQIAADLITRFQDPAVDGTLLAGDAGLLTDAGAAYDGTSLEGLASRITLNDAVVPSSGGSLSVFRDGLNATVIGPSGNSALLQALSAAISDPRSVGLDPSFQSAAGRAASLMAEVGNDRLALETELGFENARWTSLKEAEAAEGVDTDYEMQMLLRIEQAYAANARVVQTVDSMIKQLLEI